MEGYDIHNLMKFKKGSISGPMSPVMSAQEFLKALDTEPAGLCRIYFENERLLQAINEKTYYDHLVVLAKGFLAFFIDMGTGSLPVAMKVLNEKEILFAPVYSKYTNLIKPENSIIENILEKIANDLNLIKPVKFS